MSQKSAVYVYIYIIINKCKSWFFFRVKDHNSYNNNKLANVTNKRVNEWLQKCAIFCILLKDTKIIQLDFYTRKLAIDKIFIFWTKQDFNESNQLIYQNINSGGKNFKGQSLSQYWFSSKLGGISTKFQTLLIFGWHNENLN